MSLVLHALAALLFFSIATTSSQQLAQEAIEGAPALSISHVRVATPSQHRPHAAPPSATHAPKTAPARAHPAIAGHRPVFHRRELAKQNPSAPPNPTPVPLAPASPTPQQSALALASPAPQHVPAVPVNVPSAAPVIAQKIVATPAPPAAVQTAKPPKPTAAPVPAAAPKPATASPVPSAAPTAAATRAPAPAPSRAPVARSTPAARGLPTAVPTGQASPSVQRGLSPTAGPILRPASGALPVKSSARPQPARAIQLPPTPSPPPPAAPRPRRSPSAGKQTAYNHLLDRLRGALPNGPVAPSTKRYTPSAYAKPGDPTPPPEIVAKTKFLYQSRGREDRVVMYVTSTKRHGPISTCTGWLVRYPSRPPAYGSLGSNGALVLDNPGPRPQNAFLPIVEENATTLCETSRLAPFAPSASPSPGP